MSANVVNSSGQTANLQQGGAVVHTLPNGFNGPLALSGIYTVNLGGSWGVSVTTNVSNVTPQLTNGNAQVTLINNTAHFITTTLGNLSAGQTLQGLVNVANYNAGSKFYGVDSDPATTPLPSMPGVGSMTADFFGEPPVFSGWLANYQQSVTNYTTNAVVTGGQTLGDFTAGVGLRGLTIQPAALDVQDYAKHLDWFMLGFGTVLAIETARLIYSVILGVVSESD